MAKGARGGSFPSCAQILLSPLEKRPRQPGTGRENQEKSKSPGGLCGGRGSETTAGAKIEFSANTPMLIRTREYPQVLLQSNFMVSQEIRPRKPRTETWYPDASGRVDRPGVSRFWSARRCTFAPPFTSGGFRGRRGGLCVCATLQSCSPLQIPADPAVVVWSPGLEIPRQ